jgi:hypothetical protein
LIALQGEKKYREREIRGVRGNNRRMEKARNRTQKRKEIQINAERKRAMSRTHEVSFAIEHISSPAHYYY